MQRNLRFCGPRVIPIRRIFQGLSHVNQARIAFSTVNAFLLFQMDVKGETLHVFSASVVEREINTRFSAETSSSGNLRKHADFRLTISVWDKTLGQSRHILFRDKALLQNPKALESHWWINKYHSNHVHYKEENSTLL